MTTWVTFMFHHDSPDGEECELEMDVELDYEPGDPNYGADADGNRGISVPAGGFSPITKLPDVCESCGKEFNEDDKQSYIRQAIEAGDRKVEQASESYWESRYDGW